MLIFAWIMVFIKGSQTTAADMDMKSLVFKEKLSKRAFAGLLLMLAAAIAMAL